MIRHYDPSYGLMNLAGSLGVGPADFLFMCSSQNGGENVFESLFEKNFGPEWHDRVIESLGKEIELTVIRANRRHIQKMWRLHSMEGVHRKCMVKQYITWAAKHFWDPSVPGIKEVMG